MEPKPLNRFWPTTGLAIVSGMRSLASISALSGYLSKAPSPLLTGFPFGFLQKRYVAIGLKALTLAEMAGDKLPDAPDRIVKAGLIGRGLSGALAGAALYKSRNGSALAGAILGGTVAVAATYGAYYLRKKLVKSSNVNDPTIGGLEDIVALQTASLIL
ncbi:DUF4126 family protein [Mucilaginibacter arboris]|uniref:DUF4126 domain-containing protein n=1 Tax=Mucilaginibacter arboris TaxID=2682090 RepID=A0A7K1SXL8_9SPHI|nr:DUF4126 family protein [Mucilaginibacter arboris]MVN22065.1 hypothetical protein [Mucilaginibacter arboris]